jgi:hypothetical protein
MTSRLAVTIFFNSYCVLDSVVPEVLTLVQIDLTNVMKSWYVTLESCSRQPFATSTSIGFSVNSEKQSLKAELDRIHESIMFVDSSKNFVVSIFVRSR